ncbi:MAG: hypothetical protein Kow0099_37750 [Candidatus Abyssubacteria bacterium]
MDDMKTIEINQISSNLKTRHRRVLGGIFVSVGYILSPASWWNDAFVNLPIAFAVGWLAARFSDQLFLPVMILAYWATNILGLLMLHVGAIYILQKEAEKPAWSIHRTLVISTIYTLIVIVLAKSGIVDSPF